MARVCKSFLSVGEFPDAGGVSRSHHSVNTRNLIEKHAARQAVVAVALALLAVAFGQPAAGKRTGEREHARGDHRTGRGGRRGLL